MNKKWMPWAVVGGVVLVILLMIGMGYNGLVTKRENVRTALSNIESQYQRRADLVPNLVSTVKGASNFEQETLTQVVEARAKATSTQIDPTKVTPQQLQEYQAAQGELGSALSRLLVVAEQYPQLRSVENFRDLQAQLEGTENRIAVARMDFNNTARDYNSSIQRFPTNITAAVFGFDDFPYFESQQGAENAPSVNFE